MKGPRTADFEQNRLVLRSTKTKRVVLAVNCYDLLLVEDHRINGAFATFPHSPIFSMILHVPCPSLFFSHRPNSVVGDDSWAPPARSSKTPFERPRLFRRVPERATARHGAPRS